MELIGGAPSVTDYPANGRLGGRLPHDAIRGHVPTALGGFPNDDSGPGLASDDGGQETNRRGQGNGDGRALGRLSRPG